MLKSAFSAAIGALISYVYLHIKTKKANIIKDTTKKEFSKEEKKEILKKIIGYCIPFIVINIANSLYDTTDMILIIRGLSKLGFNAQDVETISSIFTTWGNKLVTVVKSFATGLTISLIPSLVNAYISKDMKRANYYFNNSLKVSKGSNPPIVNADVIGLCKYLLTILVLSISILEACARALFWQQCSPHSFSHLNVQNGNPINIDGFL